MDGPVHKEKKKREKNKERLGASGGGGRVYSVFIKNGVCSVQLCTVNVSFFNLPRPEQFLVVPWRWILVTLLHETHERKRLCKHCWINSKTEPLRM